MDNSMQSQFTVSATHLKQLRSVSIDLDTVFKKIKSGKAVRMNDLDNCQDELENLIQNVFKFNAIIDKYSLSTRIDLSMAS